MSDFTVHLTSIEWLIYETKVGMFNFRVSPKTDILTIVGTKDKYGNLIEHLDEQSFNVFKVRYIFQIFKGAFIT